MFSGRNTFLKIRYTLHQTWLKEGWGSGLNPEKWNTGFADKKEVPPYTPVIVKVPPEEPPTLPADFWGEWLKNKPSNETGLWLKSTIVLQQAKAEVRTAEWVYDIAKTNLDDTFSKRYSNIYESQIIEFKSAKNKSGEPLTEQEAVNMAGDFMKTYGIKIQVLLKDTSTTKEEVKIQIQLWREEYLWVTAIILAEKKEVYTVPLWDELALNVDPNLSEKESNEDRLARLHESARNEEKIAENSYRQAIETYSTAEKSWVESQYTDALRPDEDRGWNNGETLYWKSDQTHLDFSSRDSREYIEDMPYGSSTRFSLDQWGGYRESVDIIHSMDGSYILRTTDGGYMVCSWDKKDLEYTIELFRECAQTPIIRRMLNMGDDAFDQIRARIIAKYADIPAVSTNPEILIKTLLAELVNIASWWVGDIDRKNWEKLSRSYILSPSIGLTTLQEQLINTENGMRNALSQNLPGIFDPEQRRFSFLALKNRI